MERKRKLEQVMFIPVKINFILFYRGRKTSELILQSQYLHPDNKTTDIAKKKKEKKKIQANIIDERRCKSPQKNISKLNSTMY